MQSRNLEVIREKATQSIEKLQEYNKLRTDLKRKNPKEYQTDDLVMIKNFDSHVGVSKKLIPKFKGPYRVTMVLRNVLEDFEGFQQSRLSYKGVGAVANIRPWINNANS